MPGNDGELRVSILLRTFRRIFADQGYIEILDFGGDLRRKIGSVKERDRSDAGLAVQKAFPDCFNIVAKRRNQPDSRNDDATFHLSE
jgi:hypothetical protein